MATSISYLQTLAKDETIAFVTSLQKVKDHLSQELQWMNEQIHQKTMQLQGIEILLSEAAAAGLAPDAHSTIELAFVAEDSSSSNGAALSRFIDATDSNTALASVAVPSSPPTSTQPEPSDGRKQGRKSKPKRDAKTSTASKASAAKAKRASNVNKSVEPDDLQQFLQSTFQDKTLTESISEILDQATEPLSMSDLIAEMYDGLSNANYKRARNSLANVLSVGRSKGKWQSTGRGMYASNAVVTS